MGSGASAEAASEAAKKIDEASEEAMKECIRNMSPESLKKLKDALDASSNGAAATETKKEAATEEKKKAADAPSVKVYGMNVSQGCMGPVLVAQDAGKGGLEVCNLMEGAHKKPEFAAINPFTKVPAMKDGDLNLGESSAILRYLAIKYKPEYYPTAEPELCGWIDYAMDTYNNKVYSAHTKTVYVVMGFAGPPEDQAKANEAYAANAKMWTDHFLKGKFVCGDKVTIADFKAVPFFYAAAQPAVVEKIGLKVSDRIRQYIDDFIAAIPSAGASLKDGIGAYVASKAPDAKELGEYTKAEYAAFSAAKSSGEVKVHGMPVSQGAMGPILLAMEAGKGGMEMCDITNGAHQTDEFKAMNPFTQIPTLADGDMKIGESSANLRYLALKYKPELYPVAEPAACGRIDFAMDAFANEVHPGHMKTVYVVFGFVGAAGDQAEEVKKYLASLELWMSTFLTGKFVGGDKLSIADYKAVPFLFAAAQPVMEAKIGLKLPERALKYIEDFCAEVKSSEMFKSAGGYSLKEYAASKA